MRELPTGTLTLLFTDIEGSTRLLLQLGERYAEMLAEYRQLLRTVLHQWHGHEVDTRGDAFFVAFARATDAVEASVEMQRALADHVWPNGVAVRVRMGLHTGEPELTAEGYVGLDVHRAARIMSTGHGGQVLLSQTTRELVQHDLPDDVSLHDLGEHHLKDLVSHTHLYQLVTQGLPADFPPLNTLDSRPNNLPIQPTPFIGREQEIAAVEHLLRREDIRLVTLTGPGGIGKTRLGLQVAAELLDEFSQGVFFVNLAPISDPALVIRTIAQTLVLKEVEGRSAFDLLEVFLREKQVLLLVDNFEQVVQAAAQVAELLSACPQLKLLVTSRMALHVQAEQEFVVPPLHVPDPKRLPDLIKLLQYASVALFIRRAQAVKPDFQITNATAPAVAEICVRLDGLPLAIELAAARIKLFSPPALLTRLGQRLAILTSGPRDAPARQQMMRNTITWSHQLLDALEKRLFRQLSVFVGGCTLQAMAELCRALDASSEEGEVLEGITSLIDKSLVQQTEQEGQEPRLGMLETIREYGLECLLESGEIEIVQSAHARYFLTLAEEREPQYFGTHAIAVQDQLEREFENLRAALKCFAESGEQELALRLAGALWWFWYARGHLSEGRQWYEQLLRKSKGVAPEVRAKALVSFGWVAYILGDNAHAGPPLRESLSLYRQLGNKEKTGVALHRLGLVAEYEGDFVAAQALHEEALQIFTELAHREGIADSARDLSHVHIESGDYIGAHRLAVQALELFREIGDQWGLATSLLVLARTDLLLGDELTAHNLTKECLSLSIQLDYKSGIAACLEQLAAIAVARGEPERAAQLWGAEEALEEKAHAMGYTINPLFYEQMIAKRSAEAISLRLEEKVFAAARAQGRALTPEQILAAQELVVIPLPSSSSRESSNVLVKPPPLFPDDLTAREVEVLRLVASGLTDVEVAEQLVISPRTVNSHLKSIYGKIHVSSRSAATRYALEHQLL